MTSVVTMVSSPSEQSSIPTGLTPNHEKMYKRDETNDRRSPDPVAAALMNAPEKTAEEEEQQQPSAPCGQHREPKALRVFVPDGGPDKPKVGYIYLV